MAIFSGKILEAYYTNPDNSAIEVIYKEGNKAISYYLTPDFNRSDFKELVDEYGLDTLQMMTVEKIRNTNRQLQDIVNAQVKTKIRKKDGTFEQLTDFLLKYDEKLHNEKLFAVKIKIFEDPRVKDLADNEAKKRIRMAKTPIETIIAYHNLLKTHLGSDY